MQLPCSSPNKKFNYLSSRRIHSCHVIAPHANKQVRKSTRLRKVARAILVIGDRMNADEVVNFKEPSAPSAANAALADVPMANFASAAALAGKHASSSTSSSSRPSSSVASAGAADREAPVDATTLSSVWIVSEADALLFAKAALAGASPFFLSDRARCRAFMRNIHGDK